jgi:hypothetical protein
MPKGKKKKSATTPAAALGPAGLVVGFDPAKPVVIQLSFDSPQVVNYRLSFALPGGDWQLIAIGTDEETVPKTGHTHQVGPLPSGSRLRYLLIFTGNPGVGFKATVTLLQDGAVLAGGPFRENGTTADDGVAVRRKEITLQ